jgi:hypothetical protein
MAALDFPNNGLTTGTTYTGDNGVVYIYDGIKWVGQFSSSGGGIGPSGPQGVTGPQGVQGDVGPTGPTSIATSLEGGIPYYTSTGTNLGPIPGVYYNEDVNVFGFGNSLYNSNIIISRNSYSGLYNSGITYSQYHETVDVDNFAFSRGRGTSVSPQPVLDGDSLGDITFHGWNGSIHNIAAGVTVSVDGTPSTRIPSKIRFSTDDGTFYRTRAEISSSGTLRINSLGFFSTLTNSSIAVIGNLVPVGDLTYDLGSTSSQWRSLYVGTSTIYLGGTALSVADGAVTVNGTPVLSSDESYTPTTSGDWNGTAPTTLSEAIDRLAALVKSLNSGTGA